MPSYTNIPYPINGYVDPDNPTKAVINIDDSIYPYATLNIFEIIGTAFLQSYNHRQEGHGMSPGSNKRPAQCHYHGAGLTKTPQHSCHAAPLGKMGSDDNIAKGIQ